MFSGESTSRMASIMTYGKSSTRGYDKPQRFVTPSRKGKETASLLARIENLVRPTVEKRHRTAYLTVGGGQGECETEMCPESAEYPLLVGN